MSDSKSSETTLPFHSTLKRVPSIPMPEMTSTPVLVPDDYDYHGFRGPSSYPALSQIVNVYLCENWILKIFCVDSNVFLMIWQSFQHKVFHQ